MQLHYLDSRLDRLEVLLRAVCSPFFKFSSLSPPAP